MSSDQNGDDLEAMLARYDAMVKSLTPTQIQQAAKQFFNTKNYVRVVLLPEAAKVTP